MGKNRLYGGRTRHLVERIFKARICRVVFGQVAHTLWRQMLEPLHHRVQRSGLRSMCRISKSVGQRLVDGRIHNVTFFTREKYQRCGISRKSFIQLVKRRGK